MKECINHPFFRKINAFVNFVSGETPLHCCVRKDMLKAVQELLKHGSDVNYRNQNGFSPLHSAVQASDQFSFSIVKELVRNGYNTIVNLPDATGAFIWR